MSNNARQTALRAAAATAQPMRGAPAAPTTTRAQAHGVFRDLTRAASVTDVASKTKNPDSKKPADVMKATDEVTEGKPGLTGANEDNDPGGKDDPGGGKDTGKPNNKKNSDVKNAAGDGGDFKPMHGDEHGYDANADADTPANNSTGEPKTPSGF